MDESSDIEQRDTLLDAWLARRQEIARLEAECAVLLAERMGVFQVDVTAHQLAREAIHRSMIAEFSAAGHLAKTSVELAFDDACAMTDRHPAILESLRAGRISVAHAREILSAGRLVDDAIRTGDAHEQTRELFDAASLAVAEQDSPKRAGSHAKQIAAALLGLTLVERHEKAIKERCIEITSIEDGLARLTAVLPEYLAYAIKDRLDQLAREVVRRQEDDPHAPDDDEREGIVTPVDPESTDEIIAAFEALLAAPDGAGQQSAPDDAQPDSLPEDPDAEDEIIARFETRLAQDDASYLDQTPTGTRTMDQLRADILTDLLLAAEPSAVHGTGLGNVKARIQVTVAASTLAGADDRIAELDGICPLHPDVARDLAGRHTGWTRLFLDPTGMVTETDTYTPTEQMRRFLRARDGHCRFPGCRRPAISCDIDHNRDHARGGPTALNNLACFCRGHHVLKHPNVPDGHRWTARVSADGDVVWTAPNGRTYADPAPRRVMFV